MKRTTSSARAPHVNASNPLPRSTRTEFRTSRSPSFRARRTTLDLQPNPAARVVVVGLGPGDTAWTTPEVAHELSFATDLVGYGPYVDRVPTRPGQRRHSSDNRVEAERAAMALDLAKNGAPCSCRLVGRSRRIRHGCSSSRSCRRRPVARGSPVRILPGMTAANAVASRVGAPLGHDYAVLSLSDRLKPWDVVARRISAVAAADMAFAVYNPASKSRTWQVQAMKDLVLEHRSPETPVVIGRDVAGAEESVRVVTLGELEPSEIDMRTLLIVGSSMTTVVETGSGRQVFTPRRYPE